MNDFKMVDGVKIYLTDEEQKELDAMRALAKLTEYASLRERKYRQKSYGEQLDMLWHAINNARRLDDLFQSEFYLWRKSIKDMYPKPGEQLNESK